MNYSAQAWTADPIEAHAAWRAQLQVSERDYAEQSQRLYISLFKRFCLWMLAQKGTGQQGTKQLRLDTIKTGDIGAFLDGLKGRGDAPASARTRRTYLAEIDRVLKHLQAIGVRKDNPALPLLEQAKVIAPLRPRNIHLPRRDMYERFGQWLDQCESEHDKLSAYQIQSICMALLMVECGLTVKELQKLALHHVSALGQGRLASPGHRTIASRELTLSPVGTKWLERWLSVRASLRVVARRSFDDVRAHLASSGYQWGDEAHRILSGRKPRQALFVQLAGHYMTDKRPLKGLTELGLATDLVGEKVIYQAAEDAVFAQTGAPQEERARVRHKGPQALRNLCCARLVSSGMPTSTVAGLLGLRRNDQVWAMARQLRLMAPTKDSADAPAQ